MSNIKKKEKPKKNLPSYLHSLSSAYARRLYDEQLRYFITKHKKTPSQTYTQSPNKKNKVCKFII